MNKDEILAKSRKENKNRDYAELEVAYQAGHMAWRVGATVCCVISVISHCLIKIMLCSPWIIYFSMLGTNYLVQYRRAKRKTDLFLVVVHYIMGSLAFVFFIIRLMEGVQ